MKDLATSNNAIIIEETPTFLEEVHNAEKQYNIKHHRKYEEPKPKAKFRKAQGEINTISIGLTKGLIMTHKGKGGNGQNRKEKPFFNPAAEKYCNNLANRIAENTGDVISGNILIR